MLNKKLSIFACSAMVMLMAGCSATDPVQQHLELQKAAQEQAIENAKDQLASVPKWVITPPAADDSGMYGVGNSSSKDMSMAMKKARLQAEFELAKLYKQELSGSERLYQRDNAAGEVVQSSEFLIDKLVDAVPVVGYSVVDQKVQLDPTGKFRAYTLLKLPYDEFNKVLMSAKSATEDVRQLMAFEDLERRLEKRRQQKADEVEAAHRRQMDAYEQQHRMANPESVTPAPVEVTVPTLN